MKVAHVRLIPTGKRQATTQMSVWCTGCRQWIKKNNFLNSSQLTSFRHFCHLDATSSAFSLFLICCLMSSNSAASSLSKHSKTQPARSSNWVESPFFLFFVTVCDDKISSANSSPLASIAISLRRSTRDFEPILVISQENQITKHQLFREVPKHNFHRRLPLWDFTSNANTWHTRWPQGRSSKLRFVDHEVPRQWSSGVKDNVCRVVNIAQPEKRPCQDSPSEVGHADKHSVALVFECHFRLQQRAQQSVLDLNWRLAHLDKQLVQLTCKWQNTTD